MRKPMSLCCAMIGITRSTKNRTLSAFGAESSQSAPRKSRSRRCAKGVGVGEVSAARLINDGFRPVTSSINRCSDADTETIA